MKYAILVGDGMSDYFIDELSGRTPLQVARTPNMDRIAKEGLTGMARTVPRKMAASSDVANMSIFGYDPKEYYTGRGPLEAKSMGIELEPGQVAFRANLVTASDNILVDYSAGHISSKEAVVLIEFLNEKFKKRGVRFHSGVSYRNLMIVSEEQLSDGHGSLRCVPPHDIIGKTIMENMPKGKGAKFLRDIMTGSRFMLADHEINIIRVDLGENPANMVWLWGQGKKPSMPLFKERHGVEGAVISAVDLIKGMALCVGLKVIDVPGVTGYYDTDYAAKAEYALGALEKDDFVFVHVEAPDEAGHNGELGEKIRAIENFDEKVVGRVAEGLRSMGEYRLLVMPDHPTPIELKTHVDDPVPFAIAGTGIQPDAIDRFDEDSIGSGGTRTVAASELVNILFGGKQ